MILHKTNLIIFLAIFSFSASSKENDTEKSAVKPFENDAENFETLQITTSTSRYEEDGMYYTTDLTELHKVDRRKKKTKSSPAYLDAVGRIIVYHTDGTTNNCSGTLISSKPGQSSRVIQTAGHCFGDTTKLQKFDVKRIAWETTTKTGQRISKDLTIESLNLDADDAVLSFTEKIPFSTIKPALVESEMVLEVSDMIFYNEKPKLVIAGYSADSYKGDEGKTLTYDDELTPRDYHYVPGLHLIDAMHSVIYSGGSGGAVLLDTDLSEEDIQNPYEQMFYIGTILSLDGTGVTLYRTSKDRKTTGGYRVMFRSYEIIDLDLLAKLNR